MTEINDTMLALNEECDRLERELTACQAREKVLREKITYEYANHSFRTGLTEYLRGLLSQPQDDTALRERLKAERERCAKVCEGLKRGGESMNPECFQAGINRAYMSCGDAIRELGDSDER